MNRDLDRKTQGVGEGEKFAEAREILAAGRPAKPSTQYNNLVRWVDKQEAFERLHQLMLGRKWPEVIAGADEFLKQYPKSRQISTVRQMIAHAEKKTAAD